MMGATTDRDEEGCQREGVGRSQRRVTRNERREGLVMWESLCKLWADLVVGYQALFGP